MQVIIASFCDKILILLWLLRMLLKIGVVVLHTVRKPTKRENWHVIPFAILYCIMYLSLKDFLAPFGYFFFSCYLSI